MSEEIKAAEQSSPIVEANPEEAAKLAALASADAELLAGYVFYPFSGAMRAAMVQMTGNEIANHWEHTARYCAERGLDHAETMKDKEQGWAIWEQAIPDFYFHLTALAFLCTSEASVLGKLVGKQREMFSSAVMAWWDKLSKDQWSALTARALQEYGQASVGNNYKVQSEGKTASPNS